MTKQKVATSEELQEVWRNTCVYWDRIPRKIDLPWIEARFKLDVFKTAVKQKGLRIPARFRP